MTYITSGAIKGCYFLIESVRDISRHGFIGRAGGIRPLSKRRKENVKEEKRKEWNGKSNYVKILGNFDTLSASEYASFRDLHPRPH